MASAHYTAPSDLLRFLYNAISGELLYSSNEPAGVLAESSVQTCQLDPATDSDQDDEDAMDLENERDFLSWEVKLASRSVATHNFEARDPALHKAGREKVIDQLKFLDLEVITLSPYLI
jgi:hypothetical protein